MSLQGQRLLALALLLPFSQGIKNGFGQRQGSPGSRLLDDSAACSEKLHKLEIEVMHLKRQIERIRYAESRRRGNTLITGPLGAINAQGR
jgi:hypothetical protein